MQTCLLPVDVSNTPLQKIDDPFLIQHHTTLYIKREDLIHPQISGNKWHKLKYNLQAAVEQSFTRVISFGGAYSNHLHALAFAAPLFNLQAVGVIRGDEKAMNPTLEDARKWGMQLHYVSRQEYKKRDQPEYWDALQQQVGRAYMIPEGGSNRLAVKGCADIIHRLDEHGVDYDIVCVPCGTGSTLAGLVSAAASDKQLYGFSVLKDSGLETRVQAYLRDANVTPTCHWQVIDAYHHGGYAKVSHALLRFMKRFMDITGITLEPVYTGKMLFGLYSMIEQGRIPKGSNIAAVHTGGLQGLRGFENNNKRESHHE